MLATRPKIVSLNTNKRIADAAPRVVKKVLISIPVRITRIVAPPIVQTNSIITCV